MKPFAWALTLFSLLLSVCAFAAPQEDLVDACSKGDLAKAKAALAAGAAVNKLGPTGNPPISSAFFWPENVKLLLEKGADPNLGDYPVLVAAASNASLEVVKLLLAKKADPNKPMVTVTDPAKIFQAMVDAEKAKGDKANAGMIKIWEGMIEKAPAPTKVESSAIRTTLMQTNCVECLDLLVKAGAKTDEKDADGGNLIHVFAAFGNPATQRAERMRAGVPHWEKAGMVVPEWYKNLPPNVNGTPEQMLKVLLTAGLDINQKTTTGVVSGQTPLFVALAGGFGSQKEVLLALINNGADVKLVHEKQGSPLILAVQTGHADVVEAMHKKGADLNQEVKMYDRVSGQFVEGVTPLIYATMMDQFSIVKYLITNGATATKGISGTSYNIRAGCLQTLENKSVIFYAIETNDLEMVKYLVEKNIYNGKKMSSEQMKQKTETPAGPGWVKTTISCLDDGEYLPSEYAEKLGFKDIQKFLEEKKM